MTPSVIGAGDNFNAVNGISRSNPLLANPDSLLPLMDALNDI